MTSDWQGTLGTPVPTVHRYRQHIENRSNILNRISFFHSKILISLNGYPVQHPRFMFIKKINNPFLLIKKNKSGNGNSKKKKLVNVLFLSVRIS